METAKIIFYLAAVLCVVVIGCDKDSEILSPDIQPQPEHDSRQYNWQIYRTGGSSGAVVGANVSVQTDYNTYSATTNQSGEATISIPNSVNLPKFVVATVDHPTIMPQGATVPGTLDTTDYQLVHCEDAPSILLVKEVRLHHLGDDSFSGSANSQLQISSEGLEKSFVFNLSSIPAQMPQFRVFVRGLQLPLEIKFNGVTTSTIDNSSSDGDLTLYGGKLYGTPSVNLKVGSNRLTFKTGQSLTGWDDIEFCSLILYYP